MRRVVPALAVAMVLAGCTLPPTPDPAPGTVVHLELHVPLGKGVTLIVDGEDAIAELSANDCAGQVHQLTTPTGRYLVVQIETGCTGSTTAGNGSHGYYAEPPGGTFEQVSTPAGPARIFSNTYYECTNSCAYGTDEVALVDVGGRIIQVSAVTSPSSGETTRSRPDLVRLLQGLRRT